LQKVAGTKDAVHILGKDAVHKPTIKKVITKKSKQECLKYERFIRSTLRCPN